MAFNILQKLRGFISNSKHVMSVSYKPGTDVFVRTIKVVLIGTIILGISGFIISIIISLVATGALP